MLAVSALNVAFGTASLCNAVTAVILCTASQFALDGLIAVIINKLPNRFFGINSPLSCVSQAEIAFYKKIKVRVWKDKVWELGGLGGFSKKSLQTPSNAEYIERFIVECNKGVLTHRLSYPIGFLPMLFMPAPYAFTIALPVASVNLFLNILPTIVLRYNTPKLKLLLARIKRK